MRLEIEVEGRLRTVQVEPDTQPGRYRLTIDGEPFDVEARLLRPGLLSLVSGGRSCRVIREDDAPAGNGSETAILFAGRRYPYRVEDSRSLKSRRAHSGGHEGPKTIKASMPGRVVRVLAGHGEEVEIHQGVVVIEAMKMQNELKSPKAGVVVEVRVAPGDTVSAGDVLAVIE